MEFKKKLKQRLYIAISYLVLGLILLVSAYLSNAGNYFISFFGIALLVMGVMRIFHYHSIIKDEKSLRQREVAETDERNRMMSERAKSWAFSLSIMLAGLAVIVLSLLGFHDYAQPFAWFVCLMTVLYWICWSIIRKKY